MSSPFVTRDRAAAAKADPLPRIMAEAAYEAERPQGSSRPSFGETVPEWQASAIRGQEAAIRAAEAAGWTIERGRP